MCLLFFWVNIFTAVFNNSASALKLFENYPVTTECFPFADCFPFAPLLDSEEFLHFYILWATILKSKESTILVL